MKKLITIFLSFFLLAPLHHINASEQINAQEHMINFQYNNEDLTNVVNFIASKKGVNLLFPTKADEKLEGKLTWHLDKKVSIDQAWQLLQTILNIAGYSLIPRPTCYEIVKISPNINREPVPLFVNVAIDQLPIGDTRIRYIYYLANLKPEAEGDSELNGVLKAVLPETASYKVDPATNALLLMGNASDIRSAMALITHLDRPGFQERMEIIKLHYTQARMVADLFNNKIMHAHESNRYRLDTRKPTESSYFSKHIKIVANERSNSLIVLGRTQALERIRNFINHYIDVEPDTGKSILHVYQLQYLDAISFAKVLENIVQSKSPEGLEQSTAERKGVTGPQRYFDEVIISVDTPPESGDNAFADSSGEADQALAKAAKYHGGNKLIIAARSDDWKRIKELIERLDQPSPQVLIEVLIADLTLDDSRALGTLFRNPAKIPMPGEVNFQSAQLPPGVMPDSFGNPEGSPPPTTIGAIDGGNATDLLRQFNNSNPRQDTGKPLISIPDLLSAGSTVLSLSDSDGKTWGITQILKLIDHTKILSHPHVISTNNQLAKIENTEIRVLEDQASGSQGGTIVQTRKQVPASLKVSIVPRISVSETKDNTVNLTVTISIDEYKSTSDNTRITREVRTIATVNTGDILALGGLIRSNETDSVGETPVLSQLPIVGWLFKRRTRTKARTNLTVFISPTVIQPRLRGGIGTYTQDYLNITKDYAGTDGIFGGLKDPITRWFFHEESATDKFTKRFMELDEIHNNNVPMPTQSAVNNQQAHYEAPIEAQPAQKVADLKELLKEVDNPFAQIAQPKNVAVADNRSSKRSTTNKCRRAN